MKSIHMKRFLSFIFLLIIVQLQAQSRISREEYIDRFADVAIKEMKRTGIPASITLAQGMLESDNGNSMLALEANNHFGIKCHSSWDGKKIYKDDDVKNECFRVYGTAWESFRDHSEFLVNGSRYDFLFDYRHTDYKSWAKGLKKAGYATNPKYPDLLIKIIEDNQRDAYDKGAKAPKRSEPEVEEKSQDTNESSIVDQILGPKKSEVVVRINRSGNGVKYIDVPVNIGVASLADQLEMSVWQLKKYNDVPKRHEFKNGERVYLQPKKSRSEKATYTSKEGDTPKSISQMFGYKLKLILKDNQLQAGQQLEKGTEISMRTGWWPF